MTSQQAASICIEGSILEWIEAFLTNHHQQVPHDGIKSQRTSGTSTSGVPQGTVLGPLLFLLYVNDMTSVPGTMMQLFADDVLGYRVTRNIQKQQYNEENLGHPQKWTSTWGMVFKASKCYMMHINPKKDTQTHIYTISVGLPFLVSLARNTWDFTYGRTSSGAFALTRWHPRLPKSLSSYSKICGVHQGTARGWRICTYGGAGLLHHGVHVSDMEPVHIIANSDRILYNTMPSIEILY